MDYGPVFTLLDRRCLTEEAWEESFTAIQAMEDEALATIAEHSKSK